MSSLEIDPSMSEPEDQNDVDEDDIEVWKDVHMSLTLTIMKLQDSIAMRKAQRRFILETIVRHVPPLPETDSTDETATEGVPSNPANPNWLDDPLCGNDIFDSEKIAEIMKLQSSSRSARTTISSSVSHWVRNSNTNCSASNFLRATDAETSTGRSNNSGKQKKANNKGGKNCKPKASSKSYRKEDLQSEDEVCFIFPSAPLIKAILLNGAQSITGVNKQPIGEGILPTFSYDRYQGFGRISLLNSLRMHAMLD
mmetsp:Transcript_23366/g.46605  ORF Transcript_23366/g.46605 Transcript_23366/m.46605 type:complete len:254 (+) Transcript_23366:47-808(+)